MYFVFSLIMVIILAIVFAIYYFNIDCKQRATDLSNSAYEYGSQAAHLSREYGNKAVESLRSGAQKV